MYSDCEKNPQKVIVWYLWEKFLSLAMCLVCGKGTPSITLGCCAVRVPMCHGSRAGGHSFLSDLRARLPVCSSCEVDDQFLSKERLNDWVFFIRAMSWLPSCPRQPPSRAHPSQSGVICTTIEWQTCLKSEEKKAYGIWSKPLYTRSVLDHYRH